MPVIPLPSLVKRHPVISMVVVIAFIPSFLVGFAFAMLEWIGWGRVTMCAMLSFGYLVWKYAGRDARNYFFPPLPKMDVVEDPTYTYRRRPPSSGDTE
jgi:hypothetical protein